MPCRSDYLEPNELEKEYGRLKLLLAEMAGTPLDSAEYRSAYFYNVSKEQVDEKTEQLCSLLQNDDVTKRSLELQIWWRDHQAADARRTKQELDAIKDEADRQAAIAKLTPHERRLLGL